MLLLLASLIGSVLNISVAELPGQQVLAGQEVDFFGMRYSVPAVVDWPGTIVAVNIGGALIPSHMSLYLLATNRLWSHFMTIPTPLTARGFTPKAAVTRPMRAY